VGGVAVTAVIVTGGGTLGGHLTVNSDEAGRAAFTDLSLTGTVGGYTLGFRAGAASATSLVITLTPGAASPERSIATITNHGAHQPTTIVVQTRDQSGNDLKNGGSTIVITVTREDRHGQGNAEPITVTDKGDGSYTAFYTPKDKGTDLIAITLDGIAISGSPYTNKVH
jgi:hypothetical protein